MDIRGCYIYGKQSVQSFYSIITTNNRLIQGHESKLMMNSSTPPFKRSQVEKSTNTQILCLFATLFVIALFSAICSEIWHGRHKKKHWYIGFDGNFFNIHLKISIGIL